MQVFVIIELFMYLTIFHHLYIYNNKGVSGLSADTINKRKRQNVISLTGQCISFVVETIVGLVTQFIMFFHASSSFADESLFVPVVLIGMALVTITEFISSPELRRFYLIVN